MSYTILVIEDNEEMSDNISGILQLAHYKVLQASNGKTGVTMAQQNLPDLIICDIMMPELDGYGVIHILTRDPQTAGIPFIFLTAKANSSDFRTGMNLGADDYITKPFNGIDLLKVVEMRLKKNELLKANYENSYQGGNSFLSKTREFKEFEQLSENRHLRYYRKKDLIFMEGQSPNDLYYIVKGQVKTYKVNYDGKELVTGIHKTGEFLGYVSLLEEKPYNENAEAMEEVRMAIIPKSDFLKLIYSNKEMARKFIKMLSNNLGDMENRLLEIAYQSVRQRVASALLKINSIYLHQDSCPVITITRRDISGLVGTATESLNRTLADFKEEGLIKIKSEGIKIVNKAKLEQLLH